MNPPTFGSVIANQGTGSGTVVDTGVSQRDTRVYEQAHTNMLLDSIFTRNEPFSS